MLRAAELLVKMGAQLAPGVSRIVPIEVSPNPPPVMFLVQVVALVSIACPHTGNFSA